MEITYNHTISIADYKALVASAGWKELSNEQIEKSLKGNTFCVCANVEGKCVGMARFVSDGGIHGLLYDVVVLPQFQKLGIGRALMEQLKAYVLSTLKEGEQFLIELLPSAGKRNFYLNCGFQYKPEHMDGMYLWLKK